MRNKVLITNKFDCGRAKLPNIRLLIHGMNKVLWEVTELAILGL